MDRHAQTLDEALAEVFRRMPKKGFTTLQITTPQGQWYARYEAPDGRDSDYFPIVAWALQESEYQGQTFRDVVGLVSRYGCIQDAQGIIGFEAYCQEIGG